MLFLREDPSPEILSIWDSHMNWFNTQGFLWSVLADEEFSPCAIWYIHHKSESHSPVALQDYPQICSPNLAPIRNISVRSHTNLKVPNWKPQAFHPSHYGFHYGFQYGLSPSFSDRPECSTDTLGRFPHDNTPNHPSHEQLKQPWLGHPPEENPNCRRFNPLQSNRPAASDQEWGLLGWWFIAIDHSLPYILSTSESAAASHLQSPSALQEVLPGLRPVVGIARRQPQAARHVTQLPGLGGQAVKELGAGAVAHDLHSETRWVNCWSFQSLFRMDLDGFKPADFHDWPWFYTRNIWGMGSKLEESPAIWVCLFLSISVLG